MGKVRFLNSSGDVVQELDSDRSAADFAGQASRSGLTVEDVPGGAAMVAPEVSAEDVARAALAAIDRDLGMSRMQRAIYIKLLGTKTDEDIEFLKAKQADAERIRGELRAARAAKTAGV